ncbi:DUF1240 domain-containing protein [Proteus mirabilis]|nr:DUF1240 domain-containing protein [Proteus vulgaris]RNT30335.1 DUF1240 domain-containing protein [Proteus mirabilis]
MVFILGAFFSFFFSNYVERDLLSQGYFIYKKTILQNLIFMLDR